MRLKKFLVKTLILTSLVNVGFAQKVTLKEGWDAFTKNDFATAKVKFEKAAQNEETKADANLALSFYYQGISEESLAFKHFKEYFDNAKDPYPTLFALWKSESVSNGLGRLSDDRYNFTMQLSTEGKDGLYEAIKNEFLAKHFKNANDIKKAIYHAESIGGVKEWQILGRFENISASGFNKTHDAVKYAKDHVFLDKNGGRIEWFKVPVLPYDRWMTTSYYMYTNDAISYAQTFCNSETAQEVQLRLGIDGSYRIWLNDNLVSEREEEQINNIDAEIIKVKLNKGYNRILIQLGCSEIGYTSAMLRVTDNNGKPLDNVSFSSDYHNYEKSTDNFIEAVQHPIEKHFIEKTKNGDNDFLNYILLAYTYKHNDRDNKYLETLLEAEKEYGESVFLKYFLVDAYNQVNNETEISKELEAIKEIAPESYVSLVLMISKENENENYDEAEKYLSRLIELYGNNSYTLGQKINLASQREKIEELRSLVNMAYKQYPNSSDYVYLKYIILEKLDNNPNKAFKVLKKFTKNNFDVTALETMAGRYFETNNVYKGIDIYKNLERDFPESTSYKTTLAKIYFAMQNYTLAIQKYEEALKIAPYKSDLFSEIAKTYEEAGNTKKAIEYYKKNIEYGRYDFDSREKVRVLEGKEKLYTQFREVPDPEEIFENAPSAEDFPEDNSIMLLDETHKIVHKDGATEEKRYEMIKVFNTTGVDTWKEYSIGVYGNQRLVVEEAKVFKKDGSKLDGEVNYSYVVFTDLEEGDAIYIVYRLETFNYGKLAQHFWGKHYFDYFIPTKTNNYSLLVHENKKFKHDVLNDTLTPKITEKGDYILYEWSVKDRPSLKSEDYMPVLADVGATLHFSSFENWNEISKWYIDLSQVKQKADIELKNTVDEIFEGKENLTDIDKAKTIYDYIVKNIRYSSISFRQSGLIPQKASKVISSKLGDCKDVSTLFVTMCREVGLDAHLVLVNTRDNGDNSIHLPSIDFNHCIAKLNLDNDESYYIELTSDLIPFASQGKTLKNATILDITPETKNIQQLNSGNKAENKVLRYAQVSFKGNTMIIEKTNEKHGVYSGGMRSTYKNEGKEQQEKSMKNAISGEYIKTKLTHLKFDETLDNTSEKLTYEYSYEVEDAFTDVGGILILKLPWADRIATPGFISSDKREFPIDVWEYDISELDYEKLVIKLPSDKKLVKDKPDDITYNNKYFEYKLIHNKTNANELVIERSFRFKVDQVAPENYLEFKNEFEKVIKADERQLGFQEI